MEAILWHVKYLKAVQVLDNFTLPQRKDAILICTKAMSLQSQNFYAV